MASPLSARKKLTPRAGASTPREKGEQNIKVMVRIKPPTRSEESVPTRCLVKYTSLKEITTRDKKYFFDRVFRSDSDQLDVYKTAVAPMIPNVIAGYNCTVFAYGQTGSGKSYTMNGEDSRCPINWAADLRAGCIPRAAVHIFESLRTQKTQNNVKVSYLELYNEEIYDLLSDNESPLKIYDNGKGSVFIQGLNKIPVADSKAFCKQLEKGNLKKQIAPTLKNIKSSRSHTVFTVRVYTKETSTLGDDILKTGKLNLVDLAGSENITRSGCKDLRATELASINKSLLTLGRVIDAVSEAGQKHIPYRESKLTRILQDSLGGHHKTCMIAMISSSSAYEDIVSTLEYATRARRIKNTPTINEKVTKAQMLQGLREEIEQLKEELKAARDKSGFFVHQENYQKLLDTVELFEGEKITMEEVNMKLAVRIEELEEIMSTKEKEFDDNVRMCKRTKKMLKKANRVIKKKEAQLKQEQFVSQTYETEASQLHKQVEQWFSATKQQSEDKEKMQENLQTQYTINQRRQNTSQGVVSQITEMLNEILKESEKVESSDEFIRLVFREDINELKTELKRPLEQLKGAWETFDAYTSQEHLVGDMMAHSINNKVDTIREHTLDMKAKLNCYFNDYKELTTEDMGTITENFNTMFVDYTQSIGSLVELIEKRLTAEDAGLIKNVHDLRNYIAAARVDAKYLTTEQIELDASILNQINELRDRVSERDSRRLRAQLLDNINVLNVNEKARIEGMVKYLETSIVQPITNDPIKCVPKKMLGALQKFNTDLDAHAAQRVEMRQRAKREKAPVTADIESYLEFLNVNVDAVKDQFVVLMDKRESARENIVSSAKKIGEIVKQDLLEQFVPLTNEGDTPSQKLEVLTKGLEPLTSREEVIERFKAQAALNDNENASESEFDLEDIDEPRSSNIDVPGSSNIYEPGSSNIDEPGSSDINKPGSSNQP